jgi:glycosyltransferase involved in cell wall biosynthesis
MALGVPVVASEIGGLSEIVTHELTGLLVPSGDAMALSAACKRLVDDPDLKDAIVRAAREMVFERYSINSIGKQWMEMYQSLIDQQ